ncbi:MAG: DNA polymerase III subunit alpha [Armatimonadetes bacterium RBG_16_67_12]|nr:MAG: DNA polymerase III subunit alpha [Armatimonadetes bacterium RBG_16_67_12]
MPDPFVHCHLHTEFSLLDGASRIEPLMRAAAGMGMPAIAVTDHGTMYGAVEFYLQARQHGLTPIVGVEAYVAPRRHTDRDPKLDTNPFHLVLLATDAEGYRNLLRLTSIAHLDGFYYKPRVDRELLARHSKGLIALSGCLQGEVTRAILRGDPQEARAVAAAYRDIFGPGNVYLEIQDHGLPEQQRNIRGMREVAHDLDLPLIATNDVHYVHRDEAEAQDALMCIQMNVTLDATNKPRMGETPEFYLKSPEEMAQRFAEIPQALRSPLEIAGRVNLDLDLGKVKLPHFPVPGGETPDSYLRGLCEVGLRRLYGRPTAEQQARLDMELQVITQTGYAAYFLIVWDFVTFARRQNILTTVRGSAAGSLVLYSLGVTDVDPLRYRLPFERFLNIERFTMPDIDVDFMDSRRDEVIRYVIDKYGPDHVAQIITFGTMGARQAVRDIGRVMGLPYADVDRIAKLIPFNASIDEALRADPELRRSSEETQTIGRLLDLARKLEGVARHASTHAAGVIISRDPLIDLVPLQRATKGDLVMTQYDMDAVEKIGLLKMDFLGLSYLTILDRALKIIEKVRGVTLDLKEIPLDDRATFDLLSRGETVGIFQLEGAGMTRHVKDLKPTRIEDIMAMVALFRPGPMANIPSYIRRKHGQEKAATLHPLMDEVLADTYGVMVYQEDVMAVAQAVAGYTLAEADTLRYAVGKKIADKLAAHREKFLTGARKSGVPKRTTEVIWELFEPFARYGFNRAHAACYGLIAYQTAHLKANFPAEYMAAVLTTEALGQDWMAKVANAVAECERMGIKVLPPDVNESVDTFTVVGSAIRFGLAAVKNVGTGAVASIISARKAGGPFTSLADLVARVDLRTVNRRVLESLIKAGAFDSLGRPRALLLQEIDAAMSGGQRLARSRAESQTGLFELGESAPAPATAGRPGDIEEFSKAELLAMERDMLGMYISSHPLAHVRDRLSQRITATVGQLSEMRDRSDVVVGGLITALKRTTTKNGAAMAFMTLEDLTGSVEVIVFPKTYEQSSLSLRRDAIVVVRGRLDVADQQVKVLAEGVIALDDAPASNGPAVEAPVARREAARAPEGNGTLYVLLDAERHGEEGLRRLKELLARHRGDRPVLLTVRAGGREVRMQAGDLRVASNPAVVQEIESLLGPRTASWITSSHE